MTQQEKAIQAEAKALREHVAKRQAQGSAAGAIIEAIRRYADRVEKQ